MVRLSLSGLARAVVITVLGVVCMFASATAAGAHDDDETQEGYLLVQQALGHLAHDTSHEGMDLAMEKVDDALAAEDQDGVAVADVGRANQALEAGQVEQARALLQGSIEEALSNLPPAVGDQTGTTVVLAAQPGRGSLTSGDWTFMGVSLVFLLAGAGLAYRFRPTDTVGELRRRLGPSPAGPTRGAEPGQDGDDDGHTQ